MDENRVKEVLSDKAFVESLLEKETAEEVQAALKEKGLDFTSEQISQIRDGLLKAPSQDGELSADDLENVAGGVVATTVIAAAAAIGACIGGTGALMGGVSGAIRSRW